MRVESLQRNTITYNRGPNACHSCDPIRYCLRRCDYRCEPLQYPASISPEERFRNRSNASNIGQISSGKPRALVDCQKDWNTCTACILHSQLTHQQRFMSMNDVWAK